VFSVHINDYLFRMKIEVSNGELLDKLSILEIKLTRLSDPDQLRNIRHDHANLLLAGQELLVKVRPLYEELLRINTGLWEIEDRIREMESRKQFGSEFVETARSVYRLNDERSRLKRMIDAGTGSIVREEKLYPDY